MSKAKFDKAVAIVQSLPKDGPVQPSNEDRLFFYMYYKQAEIGDINTERPGIFDFRGRAMWDAWNSVKGKSKEECYKEYVNKLIEVLKAAGDVDSLKSVEEIEGA
ncbi:hypothetical protein AX15_001980 [Amanita polypyramis BW_CC]|nr:hypothetical protein AX15_001980 [Amanita polypyramis BW_CC]